MSDKAVTRWRFSGAYFYDPLFVRPMKWKAPRLISVCADKDLFHPAFHSVWLDRVFAIIALCPQHIFQILTDHPARMREYLSQPGVAVRWFLTVDDHFGVGRWAHGESNAISFLPNVWIGVRAKTGPLGAENLRLLLDTPAARHFVEGGGSI